MSLNLDPYHIRLSGHATDEDFKRHVQTQINNAFKRMQRQAVGAQTESVQQAQQAAITGSGSGSSTSKPITVTTQSLSAGVATTVTFAYPALLVGLPDCYTTQDGMFTLIGYTITINEPSSFSITALQDCTMKFAYQKL